MRLLRLIFAIEPEPSVGGASAYEQREKESERSKQHLNVLSNQGLGLTRIRPSALQMHVKMKIHSRVNFLTDHWAVNSLRWKYAPNSGDRFIA
jgi:hypothetical protein